MALSMETLAAAKKYTDKSIAGGGISAGKNCVVDSITDITGGHRVTFKWTLDNGTVTTGYMDVMDGDKGETGDTGLGIKTIDINAQNHLIITYDDDTTHDAGELPGGSGEVISVNGKKGVVTLAASDVGALPDDTELFSGDYNDLDNLPDLTNFITNTVDNLVNYYKKTETYTKAEVDNIANTIKNGRFEAVATLPTTDIKTNVIYLVPKSTAQTDNVKDEYINLDGTSAGWEKIGDTEIDLSGYVTTTALNTALADYTTTTDLTTLLAGKVDKVTGKGLSTNDYTNTDKELVDTIPNLAPISLVKDTVGWTGKNLLKNTAATQTISGVTFTVNTDKSVTVNGTGTNPNAGVRELNQHFTLPAGNYILSGSPHNVYSETGFRLQIYNWTDSREVVFCETDEDIPFTIGENKDIAVRIWFRGTPSTSGEDITFYPMIRRADITDPTYEPYHESVETMYEEEIHGVNLLDVKVTTQTINGITYTVNTDKSISVSGTASADSRLYWYDSIPLNGRYIFGRVEKTSFTGVGNYSIMTRKSGSITNLHSISFNNASQLDGIEFDEAETLTEIAIYIASGAVANLKIYPMLRKAEIEDSTYRPYNNQAIQNQLNAQGVLGAKNRLKVPYHHVSGTPIPVGGSVTNVGITYTVNEDGSITAGGTATAGSYCIFNRKQDWSDFDLYGKRVKLSVKPVSANVYIQLYDTDNNKTLFRTDSVTGEVEFVFPASLKNNTSWNISIDFPTGAEPNNTTYYSMLRLASDPDDTYQPYAMTNKELTKNLTPQYISLKNNYDSTLINTTDSNVYALVYKTGHMVQLTGAIKFKTIPSEISNDILTGIPDAEAFYAPITKGTGEPVGMVYQRSRTNLRCNLDLTKIDTTSAYYYHVFYVSP